MRTVKIITIQFEKTYMDDFDTLLDEYAHYFDLCVKGHHGTEKFCDDPVREYISNLVDSYQAFLDDNVFVNLLQENLVDFLRQVLPQLIDSRKKYLDIIKEISDSDDDEQKNEMQVGAYGNYVQEQNKILISNEGANQDGKAIGVGVRDYEERSRIYDIALEYPIINNILKIMGRSNNSDSKESDHYNYYSNPILLKHSSERSEIEGVSLGNNLSNLLPLEYALMDETIFYMRFVKRELQQFAFRNIQSDKKKTELKQNVHNRLERGPVIVAIDTSGSMIGLPTQISKALLLNIIKILRPQNRKLMLITYSVRAKILEIHKPSQFHKIKEFFNARFCGGTDGEDMFSKVIYALQVKDYEMADVLVISDFKFSLPSPSTTEQIDKERAKGTKFYGLCINGGIGDYKNFLDDHWNLDVETSVYTAKF